MLPVLPIAAAAGLAALVFAGKSDAANKVTATTAGPATPTQQSTGGDLGGAQQPAHDIIAHSPVPETATAPVTNPKAIGDKITTGTTAPVTTTHTHPTDTTSTSLFQSFANVGLVSNEFADKLSAYSGTTSKTNADSFATASNQLGIRY